MQLIVLWVGTLDWAQFCCSQLDSFMGLQPLQVSLVALLLVGVMGQLGQVLITPQANPDLLIQWFRVLRATRAPVYNWFSSLCFYHLVLTHWPNQVTWPSPEPVEKSPSKGYREVSTNQSHYCSQSSIHFNALKEVTKQEKYLFFRSLSTLDMKSSISAGLGEIANDNRECWKY